MVRAVGSMYINKAFENAEWGFLRAFEPTLCMYVCMYVAEVRKEGSR